MQKTTYFLHFLTVFKKIVNAEILTFKLQNGIIIRVRNMKKITFNDLNYTEFFVRHLACRKKGFVGELCPSEMPGRTALCASKTFSSPENKREKLPNGAYCVHNKKRNTNLLLYVNSQSVLYGFDGKNVEVPAGGLAFVPKGVTYDCTELPNTGYLFLEFDLFEANGEELQLGTEPVLISANCLNSLKDRFIKLYRLFAGEEFAGAMYCNIELYRMLLEVAELSQTLKSQESAVVRVKQAVQQCVEYLERHCYEAVEFEQLCALSGLCPTQLRLYFKKETGYTPTAYKNRLRMQAAERQLTQTNQPIEHLARQLGFENAFYFSRMFKEHTGVSPRVYRNLHS